MGLRLYHFEACPYCEKVRYALRWMDLRYESSEIDPADRSLVKSISGQPLVPVMVDGEVVVHDSTRILRYLIQTYGGGRLLPHEPRLRGLAWIIEEFADEVLGPLLRRASRPVDEEGKAVSENDKKLMGAELAHHYQALDQILGQEEFLLGSRLSLADVAIYAFVSRVELYSPRGIPGQYPNIRAWYERMKA